MALFRQENNNEAKSDFSAPAISQNDILTSLKILLYMQGYNSLDPLVRL